MIHELGLSISHSSFHKHGAYLLQHSDMPGFSQREQKTLAVLVASHRRKIRQPLFEELLPLADRLPVLKLSLLLRIAVILHRSRRVHHLPSFLLEATDTGACLRFPANWLEEHPLTSGELQQEQSMWEKVGFTLTIE